MPVYPHPSKITLQPNFTNMFSSFRKRVGFVSINLKEFQEILFKLSDFKEFRSLKINLSFQFYFFRFGRIQLEGKPFFITNTI